MSQKYVDYFQKKEKEWEGLCSRCGGCCGAYDDPCQHLKKDKSDKFCCEIYTARFGMKKSVRGEKFDCVLVKEVLHIYWKNDHFCTYKRLFKQGWLAA